MPLRSAARRRLRRCFLPAILSTLLAWPPAGPAAAAEIPWAQRSRVVVTVKDQPLPELLRALITENRVPVSVSEAVRGNVSGRFNDTPDKLLRDLSASFGLVCFFDGHVLHISSLGESTTRAIALSAQKFPRMKALLAEMGLNDPRFMVRWFKDENYLLVAGPPRYLVMLEELANIVEFGPTRPNSPLEVRVFPLKHAWARDIVYRHGSQESTIPGVATLLRNTLGDPRPRNSSPVLADLTSMRINDLAGSAAPVPPRGQALLPLGAVGPATTDAARPTAETPAASRRPLDELAQEAVRRQAGPSIEADPRTNAVIVRDARDRLASYEALVRELDVPVRLVEIEAAVIDVDIDDAQKIGVAWRVLSDGHADLALGTGGAPGNDAPANVAGAAAALAGLGGALSGPGGLVTSIVAGTRSRYFAATVDAMVRQDQARITSRPRVLTLDNTEAVLENQQTFYVRVAGRDAANLFQISTGLLLRVTPQIIREGERDRVKLLVAIEDGVLSSAQVDQIPLVTRKQLNTQAVIDAGDSLLVGGYAVDESSQGQVKVPVLGDLPVVGGLFKRKAERARRAERLFLLTPRIVAGAAGTTPVGQ